MLLRHFCVDIFLVVGLLRNNGIVRDCFILSFIVTFFKDHHVMFEIPRILRNLMIGIHFDLSTLIVSGQSVCRSNFINFHLEWLLTILNWFVFSWDLLLIVHVGRTHSSSEIFKTTYDFHRLCLEPHVVENSTIRNTSLVILINDSLGLTCSILLLSTNICLFRLPFLSSNIITKVLILPSNNWTNTFSSRDYGAPIWILASSLPMRILKIIISSQI